MENVFEIKNGATEYKEIKDGSVTLWERAVPVTTEKGAMAQFRNTRKTGGDGTTYPAFDDTTVLPHVKVFGKTERTIVIDGIRYIVPLAYSLLDNTGSTVTAYHAMRHSDRATGYINLLTGVFTAASYTAGQRLPLELVGVGYKVTPTEGNADVYAVEVLTSNNCGVVDLGTLTWHAPYMMGGIDAWQQGYSGGIDAWTDGEDIGNIDGESLPPEDEY